MYLIYKHKAPDTISWEKFIEKIPTDYIVAEDDNNTVEIVHVEGDHVVQHICGQTIEALKEHMYPLFAKEGCFMAIFETDGDDDHSFKDSGLFEAGGAFISFMGTYQLTTKNQINTLPEDWFDNEGIIELLSAQVDVSSMLVVLDEGDNRILTIGGGKRDKFSFGSNSFWRENVKAKKSGPGVYHGTGWNPYCELHRGYVRRGDSFIVVPNASIPAPTGVNVATRYLCGECLEYLRSDQIPALVVHEK